ncbi:MAG: Xaa-Pro peptidase family protein [Roseovarius sp.]|nr:Xaa-Pro peptidase family protein [Roseovarius sp.]
MFKARMIRFRERLQDAGIDIAVIANEDNVYYLTGYHDYLHMEFGRPTILAVPVSGPSLLITPFLDLKIAESTAMVDRICAWNDGVGDEWRSELPAALNAANRIAIEQEHIPAIVRAFVADIAGEDRLASATPILAEIRMIKSKEELKIARHAGEVAEAMMHAGRNAIGDGIPEYEVAIAASQAGTRKAAELLALHYDNRDMSPNTHFLQIMASGDQITKTHHRASTRIMRKGEAVFLCFCGMTNFHRFKLGFDRMFWIGDAPDQSQRDIYEVAVASQKAALGALGPGVTAESVHSVYANVIGEAGYDYPFRCGRATGFSFLESPQLVTGDTTILQPGMVFAVDGAITTSTFRAQVGDSFIITEDGHEQITHHPKAIEDVIL